MEEEFKILRIDGVSLVPIEELNNIGISNEDIIKLGFITNDVFTLNEASELIRYHQLYTEYKRLNEKFPDDNNEFIIRELEGRYYLKFIFNNVYVALFSAHGRSFLNLHHSFVENNELYVDHKVARILCDFSIDSVRKEREYKTYIMVDESSGYYKIGKSINPQYREKTLASDVPKIKVILTLDYDIESELHNNYEIKRVRGEWFSLTADDILYLIEHYGFKPDRTGIEIK